MLNTMASFVILVTARTARIACADRHTHTHETTTVTLSAHARRGLIIMVLSSVCYTVTSGKPQCSLEKMSVDDHQMNF